jgi:hypothetical protein
MLTNKNRLDFVRIYLFAKWTRTVYTLYGFTCFQVDMNRFNRKRIYLFACGHGRVRLCTDLLVFKNRLNRTRIYLFASGARVQS